MINYKNIHSSDINISANQAASQLPLIGKSGTKIKRENSVERTQEVSGTTF